MFIFTPLVLAGFSVLMGELDEAVAVVILPLIDGAQIIRRNPNAAALAPHRLRVGWHSSLSLRSLHRILPLLNVIVIGDCDD